jgi:PAS domain S-box-containing protein
VDTANAPIFGIDVKGNVNEWNDKTAEITGFRKAEAMGYPLVSTFIVPKMRKSVQNVLDNALQGHETSNYELEFRTKVSAGIDRAHLDDLDDLFTLYIKLLTHSNLALHCPVE